MRLRIKNYDKFIKTRKSIIERPKKKGLAKFGKGGLFILPPLNTNIILTDLAKKFVPKKRLARAEDLGVSLDLRTKFPGRIIIAGSRTDPATNQFQQYSCGCCWAYAIATSISDAFVVVNNYATNPNLSWTYLLSCYPHQQSQSAPPQGIQPSAQCGGGNVASAMTWIQTNGIATKVCVDYSWCINSTECTGQGGDPNQMNQQIPSCGCYVGGNFLKYKIKEVQNLCLACADTNIEPTNDEITNFRNILKSHLKNVGPAIGCFHVFSNLVDRNPSSGITGDFKTAKNPEGVYLECVGINESFKSLLPTDENQCPNVSADATELGLLGAHAVSVIGWGEAPVHKDLIAPNLVSSVPVSPNDPNMVMIPYWWIRNSWGDTYAEKGFYKKAMYPFNRVCQIERSLIVETSRGAQQAGGVVIFKPDTIITEAYTQNDQKGLQGSGNVGEDESPNIGFFEGKEQQQTSSGGNVSAPAATPPSGNTTLSRDRFLPQNDKIPAVAPPPGQEPVPIPAPAGVSTPPPLPATFPPPAGDEFKDIETPPELGTSLPPISQGSSKLGLILGITIPLSLLLIAGIIGVIMYMKRNPTVYSRGQIQMTRYPSPGTMRLRSFPTMYDTSSRWPLTRTGSGRFPSTPNVRRRWSVPIASYSPRPNSNYVR